MTKLSVNINKVATLRNARGEMFRTWLRWRWIVRVSVLTE